MNEHAVIVEFKYGLPSLDALFELEDRLHKAIAAKRVGEYDGHEIAADLSHGTLFMYGPDADLLLAAVQAVLKNTAFMAGATVLRRYGPANDPKSREVRSNI